MEEAALALGIAPLLDRSTHELSGGELQRVALGAALVGRPRVALLDEPTSQLDPVAGDELLGVLRRLNEEWGTAVILAEHRLERCLSAADRVVALRDGAIACDADPRGFLDWAGATRRSCRRRARGCSRWPARRRRRSRSRRRGARSGGARRAAPRRGDAGRRRRRARRAAGAIRRRRGAREPALALASVWLEHKGGAAVLRGVDLAIAPGERVALMGRNGAGKSTLLRVAAGLLAPTRGKVRGGRVALLLQNPGDYALRDRVGDELPADALAAAGLAHLADRHPRDLSGGERQRLALAIVLTASRRPVVCLDEPTRGMDRAHKDALAALLAGSRREGTAVIVATHDAEFAAAFAERTVLLGDGRAGRRRADRRGARRRLVLRHPDRPDPRRRRAAAGGGRRAAARREEEVVA